MDSPATAGGGDHPDAVGRPGASVPPTGTTAEAATPIVGRATPDLADQEETHETLRCLPNELEARVTARTAELDATVAELREDLTRQKETIRALREQTEAALVASRLKSEFLAHMSHEIRTPMGGILGMTDLLVTTRLNDEQRDYAATIRQGAEALLAILNDILDYSKIEAGKLALDAVPLDLGTLLEDVADLLAPVAHQKGLRIACQIPPDFPEFLVGDPVRLRQILTNLAGNSVKFTDAGEVILAVEVLGRAGDDVSLRLTVTDTGVGIPRHRQDAVFESFTQSDGGTARRFGGTGLGLAICRRLTLLMGGTIGLVSEPGRGSLFRVELALKSAPCPQRPRQEMPSGFRALVVADDPTTRAVLVGHLHARGCHAETAAAGPETLRRLTEAVAADDPFALAILDEGADANATAEAIAGEPRLGGLPLLLLHALGSRHHRRPTRSPRFTATLARPVRRERLDEALAEATGGPLDRPAEPAGIADTDTDADADADAPQPGLRVLLAEDNEVNRKVALSILRRWGCRVDAVGDGREALEALGRSPYDVVLMDLQMPDMDGLAATAEIRRRERETGRHVPIVAMTAHALQGDRDRCLAAGMDDYLAKPVRPIALREALARLVPVARDPDPNPQPDPDPDSRRSDRLREAGGDDGEFEREVLGAFRDEAPTLLDALGAALEAGDGPAALAAAHSLKGICLTIGADSLAAAFREVEGEAARGEIEAARSLMARLAPPWRGLMQSLESMGEDP